MFIDVSDLQVRYPGRDQAAVERVSFGLHQGQMGVLIGPSGCGKTTLLRAVAGLEPVSGGVISMNGQVISSPGVHHAAENRRIGMVFQDYALFPHLNVEKNIAFGLSQWNALEREARVQDMLSLVGLSSAARRYPHELSGGQRQRVMISIALACGPDLLIADEPTTALDVTVQKEVLALIQQLVREDGMGLLLISHDLGLMQDQVDRVMVMYGGAVVESAATPELFAHRAHPYTRGLFAARPRLGLARGTRLTTIPGSVPELMDFPVGCAFADRCSLAVEDCRQTPPQAQTIDNPGAGETPHVVSCPRWRLP